MTIYLVQESSGCYEDYYTSIIKAFFDIDKAENYKATCEKEINNKIERANKCENCSFYRNQEFVKNSELFIEKATKFCSDADFRIDDNNEIYLECHYFDWDLDSTHYEIIPIEVE